MSKIQLKRVYEEVDESDGFRVFVDRLWPRGMKKEAIHYDLWAKHIAPSSQLRTWVHQDPESRWDTFSLMYQKELKLSEGTEKFIELIRQHPVVTLLFASKSETQNHAMVLKAYLENSLKG